MKRCTTRRAIAVGLLAPIALIGSAIGASGTLAHSRIGHVKVFPGTINASYTVSSIVQDYPLELAKDDGIFAKYGLNVNVEVIPSATTDPALESGAIQFTIDGPPLLELAYQSGVPIKLIGMTSEHNEGWIDARPGITSLAQLAGKSIGVSTSTAISTIEAKYALHAAGVPASAVTYVPTGANGTQAFIAGEVAATAVNFVELRQVQAALPGATTLYNLTTHLSPWPTGDIWGNAPWMASHKAETVAFLRALNAAVVKWNADPTLADHEVSIYAATTSPTTIAQSYTTSQQLLNHGSVPVHVPSTHDEAYVNKVLRLVGFPTAYNSYAKKGQEWTPVYWDAAFGKS